jgi:hypothetical protein
MPSLFLPFFKRTFIYINLIVMLIKEKKPLLTDWLILAAMAALLLIIGLS